MNNQKENAAEIELVEEIEKDFALRQSERRTLERGWQLNLNFVNGKQYCDINAKGELFEEDSKYYWQDKRVFNHIAPAVDLRCSKLGRIRPALIVRAASGEESDKHSASLASAILSSVADEADLDGIISQATVWAETCGTVFYKIIWDGTAGGAVGRRTDGRKLKQGDVNISVVSPFELYPESLSEENISAQRSIIHAKAVPVEDIYSMYGVRLAGRDIENIFQTCGDMSGLTSKMHACELVIERYARPTEKYPQGRLTVIAGGRLLFDGILPYVNSADGERGYPFVRQTSLPKSGSFFGASVVERLIPLQRAYNAVKNRKHEFLNRISMGTVAVEDGSVDTDELMEDGLTPGKIIVYRQGGKPPEMLTLGSVPQEFSEEEERLLKEFTKVAGAGELSENADGYAGITSATGIQIILEQDEIKMDYAYRQIKCALKNIGRQVLRLYRQFASDVRLLKFAGENNVLNLYYFKGSDISSDDVYLEADNDANLTPAQRRSVIYEILDRGLLTDENGVVTPAAKSKVLSYLGFNGFAAERDLSGLNRARAGEENLKLVKGGVDVNSYDDDRLHITEHTAFILTENLSDGAKKNICAHIDMHKNKIIEKEKLNEQRKQLNG